MIGQLVGRLTDAFEDDALRSQAFERIRLLIDTGVLKPEGGELVIHLRGELASMLIQSVTIYPGKPGGPEAEVVATVADVLACATTDDAAREGGVMSSCGIWLRGQDLNL